MKVEADMYEGRYNHGVQIYGAYLWAFGGVNYSSLTSVERLHRVYHTWQNAPRMSFPKDSFTPTEHQDLIYLPAGSSPKTQLEVFNPVTVAYRLLPLQLFSKNPGFMSFIVDDLLYFLDRKKQAGSWALESRNSGLTPLQVTVSDQVSLYVHSCTVKFGASIYWLDRGVTLVKFNTKTLSVEVCEMAEIGN